MFNSLREWCKFPVYIHGYAGISAAGDISYAAAIEARGYRVDEEKLIVDKFGKEVVSSARVYLPCEYTIGANDMLAFPEENIKRDIRKVSGFYDGESGELSLWVVYL